MNDQDINELLHHWGEAVRHNTAPPQLRTDRLVDAGRRVRRGPIVAAVLVTILIAGSAAIFGLHRADRAVSPPMTSVTAPPSPSTLAAPPPALPASVAANLTAQLTRAARAAHDDAPRNLRYTLTTEAKLETLTHSHDGHADPDTPLYLLAADGSFSSATLPGGGMRGPGQSSAPDERSKFLFIAVDVKTLASNVLGLDPERPDLKALGTFAPLP